MKLPVLSWIVCVLALIGLLAWLGTDLMPPPQSHTKDRGKALVGGAYSLTDTRGQNVTEQALKGHYTLVYFGFTHCPDICPTSLLVIQNAVNNMKNKKKDVRRVFITLDPERDTQEAMAQYVSHFGEGLVGLTGTPAQVKQAADAYKVYYRKAEDKDSAMGYVIDHSGFIYLMGPDGEYITHFPHTISEQALTDGLSAAMK